MSISPSTTGSGLDQARIAHWQREIDSIVADELGQHTPIRNAQERALEYQALRQQIIKELEDVDLAEEAIHRQMQDHPPETRPWISRFNEQLDWPNPEAKVVGLSQGMWSELSTLPAAQLAKMLEAVVTIVELYVGQAHLEPLVQGKILHLFVISSHLRDIVTAQPDSGQGLADRCHALTSVLLLKFSRCPLESPLPPWSDEKARERMEKRERLFKDLEATDEAEETVKDQMHAYISESRPWITRFNEEVALQLCRTEDFGLSQPMLSELFALPEAQLSRMLEAVLNILEIQVRHMPSDSQGRAHILHLLMVCVKLQENMALRHQVQGVRQEERCKSLIIEILAMLGRCQSWKSLTRAEAQVVATVLDEVLDLPLVVVKLMRSLLEDLKDH